MNSQLNNEQQSLSECELISIHQMAKIIFKKVLCTRTLF